MSEALQQFINHIEIRSYLSIAVYFSVLVAAINGYRSLRVKGYLVIAVGTVLILQNYISAVIPAVDEEIIKAIESSSKEIPRMPIIFYISMYMAQLGVFLMAIGIWLSAKRER